MHRPTLLAVALLTMTACGADTPPDPCVDSPTYTNDVGPIVELRCLACHSTTVVGVDRMDAPETLNYNSYDLIQPSLSAVSDALTSGRMPPPASGIQGTTIEERELVGRWRTCGYRR